MRISLSAGVRGFSSAVERRRCLATGVMLRGGTSEIARYAIRRLAVEEQPLPDLECHERPKLLAPIRSAIVGAIPPGVEPSLLRWHRLLEENGVVCAPREGMLRFSPHLFNEDAEVDKVIDLLART